MNEWQLVGTIVTGVAAVLLIVDRAWRGSRVYATAESVDKAHAVIHKRIDDKNTHDVRQDQAIHAIQLSMAQMSTNMKHMGDSMERLAASIDRLIEKSLMGSPQCQVATDKPKQLSDSAVRFIRDRMKDV